MQIGIGLGLTSPRKAGGSAATDFSFTSSSLNADAPTGSVAGVFTETSGASRPNNFSLSLNSITADAPTGTVVGTLG